MTESEAKGFVQGKLDCMKKCDVFNKEDKHRNNECELCEYCYSQGNFGNQKEAFSVAINALEKQIAKKVKSDLISRSKVISVLEQLEQHSLSGKMDISNAIYLLENQPTAYDIDKVTKKFERKIEEIKNTEYAVNTFVNESIRTIVINTIFDLEEIVKAGAKNEN